MGEFAWEGAQNGLMIFFRSPRFCFFFSGEVGADAEPLVSVASVASFLAAGASPFGSPEAEEPAPSDFAVEPTGVPAFRA